MLQQQEHDEEQQEQQQIKDNRIKVTETRNDGKQKRVSRHHSNSYGKRQMTGK